MRIASVLGTSSFPSLFPLCRECLGRASCALPLLGTVVLCLVGFGVALSISCRTCGGPFSLAGIWQAERTLVAHLTAPQPVAWASLLPAGVQDPPQLQEYCSSRCLTGQEPPVLR